MWKQEQEKMFPTFFAILAKWENNFPDAGHFWNDQQMGLAVLPSQWYSQMSKQRKEREGEVEGKGWQKGRENTFLVKDMSGISIKTQLRAHRV